jgi:hypothetical protein
MSQELQPKILEYRIWEKGTPELILEFHAADPKVTFAAVDAAIEEVVGVYFVNLDTLGKCMKVVLRNDEKTLTKVRNLIEKGLGYRPFVGWSQRD